MIANPTLKLVDSPEEGIAVTGWPMLPIHPKLACLSLRSFAGKVVMKALEHIPAQFVDEKRVWVGLKLELNTTPQVIVSPGRGLMCYPNSH